MKSTLFHLYIILQLSYTSCCPASQFKTVKWVFGQMVHNGNADAVAQHVGHSPETVPVGKHRADWSWEEEFISYTSLKLYLWHCNILNSAYRSFRFFFSLTPVDPSTFCYKQLKESKTVIPTHSQKPINNQEQRDAFCWQSNRRQHHHHGHHAGLWDPCRSGTGSCDNQAERTVAMMRMMMMIVVVMMCGVLFSLHGHNNNTIPLEGLHCWNASRLLWQPSSHTSLSQQLQDEGFIDWLMVIFHHLRLLGLVNTNDSYIFSSLPK